MLAREGLAEDGMKAAREQARKAAQTPEAPAADPPAEESASASPFGSASPVEKLHRSNK